MRATIVSGMLFTWLAVALAASSPVLAQSVPTPEGLDDGAVDYIVPNQRPDPDWAQDEDLSALVTRLSGSCFTACHNAEKRDVRPSTPYIAGQKFYYTLKQLELFNTNNPEKGLQNAHDWETWQRSNVNMNQIALKVPTKLFIYISDYISKMPCDGKQGATAKRSPPMPPKLESRCASCHGADGQGTAHNVPILAGQSYIYLRNQLVHIRSTERGEDLKPDAVRKHPTMEPPLTSLTDSEINQLARYFSVLDCRPVPGASAASSN